MQKSLLQRLRLVSICFPSPCLSQQMGQDGVGWKLLAAQIYSIWTEYWEGRGRRHRDQQSCVIPARQLGGRVGRDGTGCQGVSLAPATLPPWSWRCFQLSQGCHLQSPLHCPLKVTRANAAGCSKAPSLPGKLETSKYSKWDHWQMWMETKLATLSCKVRHMKN